MAPPVPPQRPARDQQARAPEAARHEDQQVQPQGLVVRRHRDEDGVLPHGHHDERQPAAERRDQTRKP
jgi:hypothetical protein